MTTRAARLVLLLIAIGVCGCDQGTKRLVKGELEGRGPAEVIGGAVDLRYAENDGMAFNAERVLPAPVRTPLLLGAGLAALAALGLAWYRHGGVARLSTIGAAVIAGGAAGNLADRFVRGYVIDFVHVHGWPVFNVADVALGVGVGLMVLAAWRTGRASSAARCAR